MKLGAQLYSVRNLIQTPEDTERTFRQIAAMGYENVQFSGGGPIPAETLRDISEKTNLPIVITHISPKRLLEDTEAVIAEHKIYNCPVIGIGAMPKEYRGSFEGLDRFLAAFETPVKKIQDAGLQFGYHNHNFEFEKPADGDGSVTVFERMLEECRSWKFILDVCWAQFGGMDVLRALDLAGKDRLWDIHYKDMKKDPIIPEGKTKAKPVFVPCGKGILDFKTITEKCLSLGVRNVLVEQDNAADLPDPMGEMEESFRYLRKVIPAE